MNALIGSFINNQAMALFHLNTMFSNISSKGQTWGFEIITAVGMLVLIYAAYCVFKALSAQGQGAGSYWLKFALGGFVGGALVFYGQRAMKSISGPNTFSDITGNFVTNVAPYVPNVKSLFYLIV